MCQALRIDHITILSLPKRSNGVDFAFGAHRFHPMTHILCTYLEIGGGPTTGIWLTTFDLMNIPNGLDLDLHS